MIDFEQNHVLEYKYRLMFTIKIIFSVRTLEYLCIPNLCFILKIHEITYFNMYHIK